MNYALIIIDIQKDYFPGGACELDHPEAAAENAKELLELFRHHELPVYHVQHISDYEGAGFFLPNTPGAEFYPPVAPQPGERVVIKHVPNAFAQTGLAQELQNSGINHLVICGMMSHMCIDTSVRAAKDYCFTITLLEDACTTLNLTWSEEIIPAKTVHQTIMASLNQVFAHVMQTRDFLQEFQDLIPR